MSVFGTITASFLPLRIRNLRIYLGGQVISLVGTWLQATAQGWVVWQLTGSTVELGVTSMLSSLPIFLLGPWAGAWADKLDRRKLLIATQAVAMLLAFVLAALVLTNTVRVWHIYGLSLLLGIITALDMPTAQAFLGDLAGAQSVRQAVNLNVMIIQISRVLGPAIAGVIVGVVGAGIAFFLNGLSFLAVIISLLIVRTAQAQFRAQGGQSALRGFAEALAFIRGQPRLRDCILFAALVTFFGLSIILSILPAVADEVLGGDAATLGLLMGASGAGSLVGTVIVAPLVQAQKRVGMALALMLVLSGLCFLALGLTNVLPVAVTALFLAGLVVPPVLTTVMGILQVSAPPMMRARVMGLFTMVSFGLQPVASIWIGFSAQVFGIHGGIVLNALGLMTGAALMVSRAPLRRWEGVTPVPEPVSAAHR